MRIALVGDVMLGRLVNQMLKHSDPAYPSSLSIGEIFYLFYSFKNEDGNLVSILSRYEYHTGKVSLHFQLSFPIDFFNLSSCFCKLERNCSVSQSVWRNGIILIDHCCDWTWNWDNKN